MASVDELNAAFKAVYTEAMADIPQLPWMAQGAVSRELQTVEGRTMLLHFVQIALGAAEKVRSLAKVRAK